MPAALAAAAITKAAVNATPRINAIDLIRLAGVRI
jgi:hypothetical protein